MWALSVVLLVFNLCYRLWQQLIKEENVAVITCPSTVASYCRFWNTPVWIQTLRNRSSTNGVNMLVTFWLLVLYASFEDNFLLHNVRSMTINVNLCYTDAWKLLHCICLGVDICVVCIFFLLFLFGCQYQCTRFPGNTSLYVSFGMLNLTHPLTNAL